MAEVEKFDAWRQRAALVDLAESQSSFLATAEGAAFLEQLHEFFSPTIASLARGWGYHMERDEVVHMIVERLLTTLQEHPDRAPIRFAAAAEDPWGYLWTCAKRWAHEDWGTRAEGLEQAEMISAPPVMDAADSDLTPLDEVVRLTFEELAMRVDARHHAELFELVGWLAANPPQRLSYEGRECVAAHRICPGFTLEQVAAVMNISWGGRPRQAETSLMGQFLRDARFRPSSSYTHMRALIFFKNAFRAARNGSRMLTDWT